MEMLPGGQSSPSIYHIPSVFFNELVERERGLRMMLMVGLFLPRYICKHTHKAPGARPPPPRPLKKGPPGALGCGVTTFLPSAWVCWCGWLLQAARDKSERVPLRCCRSSSGSGSV